MRIESFSPIIIIGMHRSGTSLITQMLRDLGLFVGRDCDEYYESQTFFQLNEWLLAQSGAAWDQPESIKHLLQNHALLARVLEYLHYYLRSPRCISFLGPLKYLLCHSLFNIRFPWGWKDPRNTITLPIWRVLFPELKIIHVYRHGVDVAYSLQVREQQFLAEISGPWSWFVNGYYTLRPGKARFGRSASCHNLEEAFRLWEIYMVEAKKQIASLPGRSLEIKYEMFLSEPNSGFRKIVQFCGLQVSDTLLQKAVMRIKEDRAYAFQRKPNLVTFAESVKARLGFYGY